MSNQNETVKRRLQSIAKSVDDKLPDGYGFTILVYNFGESPDNEMMYISNSNRDDIVKAMKEWIKKTEKSFGNDTGKY